MNDHLSETLFVHRLWTYILPSEQKCCCGAIFVICMWGHLMTCNTYTFSSPYRPPLEVFMASIIPDHNFPEISISIRSRSQECIKTAVLGCGLFLAFRSVFSIWRIRQVVRLGNFTQKQLRLFVLNKILDQYRFPTSRINESNLLESLCLSKKDRELINCCRQR